MFIISIKISFQNKQTIEKSSYQVKKILFYYYGSRIKFQIKQGQNVYI